MTVPVFVTPDNGLFAAALAGNPEVRAVGATRDEALAAFQVELQGRLAAGELVCLEVSPSGVSGLAGKYADDPTLREICEEASRLRDAV